MVKRPLVLLSIAFIAGIALYGQPMPVLAVVLAVCLLYAAGLLFVEKRRYGRAMDVFLLLLPVCFLAGNGCMQRQQSSMKEREAAFLSVLADGKEIYAQGQIRQLSKTAGGGIEVLLGSSTAESCETGNREKVGTLLLYLDSVYAGKETLKLGDTIRVYGNASAFEAASNPGQFDAAEYYRAKWITGRVNGKKVSLQKGAWISLTAFTGIKEQVYEVFLKVLEQREAGVLAAMLLGEKALLDTELETLYQESGIAHILAVSGLHISLLGFAVYRLFSKLGLGRNASVGAACLFVSVYGLFTGFSLSTQRAVIMFLLMMAAKFTGRTYDMPSAVFASAVCLLIFQPMALFSASFLLSYSAIGGVLLYQSLFERKLCAVLQPLLLSCCIQLIMLPVLLYFFYEVPPYAILINLLVLPLVSVVLFGGGLTAVFGSVSTLAGAFFAGSANAILHFYELLCQAVSYLPFSLVLTGKPEEYQIVLYYLLLAAVLLFVRFGQKRWALLFTAALPLLFFVRFSAAASVTFLDVSQGDCILLAEKEAGMMLVDCGSTDKQKVGSYRLLPYLKANGVRELAYVVVTHADADHINGVEELLAAMEPASSYRGAASYRGTVGCRRLVLPLVEEPDNSYLELQALAREKGVELLYFLAGDKLNFGKWELTCLYPEEGARPRSKNDTSLVFAASYGALDILLTGDVETEGEACIRNEDSWEAFCEDGIEFLKVAHHGSATSSSYLFLQEANPDYAIVSCGKNNRYGHPHKEIVARFEELSIEALYTMQLGAVTVKTDGTAYRVYTGKDETERFSGTCR